MDKSDNVEPVKRMKDDMMSKEKKDEIEKVNCEEELKLKQSDLSNREATLQSCKAQTVLLDENLRMALQGNALQSEECRLIMSDPLDYQKKDSWVLHMKKRMNYNLAQQRIEREYLEAKSKADVRVIDDQQKRCEEDIPKLKKKVKELKRRIEKFK